MLRTRLVMLLLFPLLAVAQEQAPPAEEAPAQSSEEIAELVETLKDPAARDALISDLEALVEAREAAADQEAGPGPGSTLDVVRNMLTDAWNAILAVDPRQLAISSAISVGIIVAALLLRWVLLTLARRLYARLTRGAVEEKTESGEPGTAVERKDKPPELETAPPSPEAEEKRAELPSTVSRLLTLIIGVVAAALIAETWGGGLTALLQTTIGVRLVEAALAVLIILVVTVALMNAAELLVERLLKLGSRKMDRDRTARRLDTLVPLLSSVLRATISVMAGLLILSELGVNIGPLLAGAGILGLAVGFGAQTLVKDLITGVTILLEDSATVGDVIEVNGHSGVVEEMRIRVIQLRDLRGIVHFVPYSDVTSIKNFTKDFSYYLFEVGVAYREDTDEVCRILLEIGDELQKDGEFGRDILESLEILGVDRFADSAVIVRARLKTVPGSQWRTGREFNRRMKKRFDEEGIEIPFPHTTVYFGEPKEGKAPPARLALAGDTTEALTDGKD